MGASTPWWSNLIFLAAGWGLKVLYDWKIHPAITKSQKEREKKEAQEQERKKKEKEEKIASLNQIWENDRKVLRSLQQPLKEFNQMNRFPDSYPAKKCLELATHIENEAKKFSGLSSVESKTNYLSMHGEGIRSPKTQFSRT